MFRYTAFLPPCFLPDVPSPVALAHSMTAATLTLAGQLQHLYADVTTNYVEKSFGLAQAWALDGAPSPAPVPASALPGRWVELSLVIDAELAPEWQPDWQPHWQPERQRERQPEPAPPVATGSNRPFHDAARAILANQASMRSTALPAPRPAPANDS